MIFPIYNESIPFPNDCWFGDWQPRNDLGDILTGELLIRKRDSHATIVLISLPVGKRGMTEEQAEAAGIAILKSLVGEKTVIGYPVPSKYITPYMHELIAKLNANGADTVAGDLEALNKQSIFGWIFYNGVLYCNEVFAAVE